MDFIKPQAREKIRKWKDFNVISLRPSVDFPEESSVNLSLHPYRSSVDGGLVDLIDELANTNVGLLLVFLVDCGDFKFVVELLHPSFRLGVFDAVVFLERLTVCEPDKSNAKRQAVCDETYVQDTPLLRSGLLQSDVDWPCALVVNDVGSNLANLLVGAECIEIVILDLEVLAHGDENALRLLMESGGSDSDVVHAECDREIEGVVSGLIDDDQAVTLEVKLGEVDFVFWGRNQVDELAHLSLERHLK